MTRLGVAPSEFWCLRPKHFWWLLEALDPPDAKRRVSADDKRDIADWLNGSGDW